VVFEADYDKIELQKYSYDVSGSDVIHHYVTENVTKITSQIFFHFGPFKIFFQFHNFFPISLIWALSQSKFLATSVLLHKRVLCFVL